MRERGKVVEEDVREKKGKEKKLFGKEGIIGIMIGVEIGWEM